MQLISWANVGRHQLYKNQKAGITCVIFHCLIRNYDPRYLAVSMEFRSYDENALLIMLVSDNQRQLLALSLRDGMIHLQA